MTTRLAQLIFEARMSQRELAARSGVSREHINKLANGHVKVTKPTIAVSLAWALSCDVDELAYLLEVVPAGPRSRTPALPLLADEVDGRSSRRSAALRERWAL